VAGRASYYAEHLGHSMRVVAVAPSDLRARRDTGDLLYAGIMIDAFYVNLRLMAEFLLGRGDSQDDVGMPTFGVSTWNPPKEIKRQLDEYHGTASKFVTHYSNRRVSADDPTGPVAGFAVDLAEVETMARGVLTAIDLFITQMPDGAEKGILRKWHDWAQERLGPDTGGLGAGSGPV
jgi:hypothetical protein